MKTKFAISQIRLPSPWFSLTAAAAMGIAAAILWARIAGGAADGYLRVHFFDVGQGDSILIVTPSGRQALIDGGPGADSASQALADALPPGDRSLDLVIMTHPDADHGRGLLALPDRYTIAAAISGPPEPGNEIQMQWQQQLRNRGVKQFRVSAGYTIKLDDGVDLQVLNPPSGRISDDSNNNSLVFRLTYGEVSFLLTADIDQSTEQRLLREKAPLQSTVLKVAHHGSKTSTGQKFLTAVNPKIAIISAGQDNQYGHPGPGCNRTATNPIGRRKRIPHRRARGCSAGYGRGGRANVAGGVGGRGA